MNEGALRLVDLAFLTFARESPAFLISSNVSRDFRSLLCENLRLSSSLVAARQPLILKF